ncbi:MAG: chorismate synthase [Synergistales bacterium]|nr:chorismate synthase [Synergistales bacterium]
MIRFLTSGESHGQGLQVILEGFPSGMQVDPVFLEQELARRRRGYGRGPRMQIEKDRLFILGGVRNGISTGSPIGIILENTEWNLWKAALDPRNADPHVMNEKKVTCPRPGHADLPGAFKFHHGDIRDVLERASARSTAALTLAGTVARMLLLALGVSVRGAVTSIGTESILPPSDENGWEHAMSSSLGLPKEEDEKKVIAEISSASMEGETLGGTFLLSATGLPPGIGSYTQWDRRLDGRLAGAMMSIPGIKGVEIGEGFSLAGVKGSSALDEILPSGDTWSRSTNRAGGIEGGMTNGEEILVKVAMKPIPTLRKALRSVDLSTGHGVKAAYERSDVCAVPAACVVGEAMMSWVLAGGVMERFGGDHLSEVMQRFEECCRRRENFFHEHG